MSLAHLLLFVAVSVSADDGVVTTLDGRSLSGEIVSWDAKEVVLKTTDGEQRLPTATLLDIRWNREGSDAPAKLHLELVDGTRLGYSELTLAKREATIKGAPSASPLRISQDIISVVELQPSTPAIAKVLDQIGRKGLVGDTLVITNRGAEALDYIPGVLGDVGAEQAAFEFDGQKLDVKRSKIAAILFFHAKRKPWPEPTCELTAADGSTISARKLSLKDNMVQVTTPAGAELEFPIDQLERADFSAGKLIYLSDLKPTEVAWKPRIALPAGAADIGGYGLPRNNISFTGSPLSLLWKDDALQSRRDVRTYTKGLAIRSRTELTYRLPEGMKRFAAVAGIDPASASEGNVLLEIRVDDRVLWQGAVDGKQPPVEIDVDLNAARRLHLTVDYGENLDYGDRLHLVEARVTK